MELKMYKTLKDLMDEIEDLKDLKYTVTTLTDREDIIDRFKEQCGYKIFGMEFDYDEDHNNGLDIDRGMRVYTFLHKKLIDNAKSIMIPYIRVNTKYYPIYRTDPMSHGMVSNLCRSIFDNMYYVQSKASILVCDGYLNLKLDVESTRGLIMGFIVLEDVCYQTRKRGIDILLNSSREWCSNMKINGKPISEYYTQSLAADNPFEIIDVE